MKQISKSVYQISMGAVNAFIVEDNGLTLIDTGFKNSRDKIFAAIRKGGKSPEDIKQIILTHSHPDHSGSAADIRRLLSIPVYAHPEDAALLETGIGARDSSQLAPGFLNRIIYSVFIKNSPKETEVCMIDHKITDNDILPIAGGIQVIHTPGHSKGHVALLVKREGVLISGDICAHIMGLGYSTVYEDIRLGVKSILKAASFDFDIALFGHGNALDGAANKKMRKKFEPLNQD